MMKSLASALMLSFSIAVVAAGPSCENSQTCVWANATQMVVRDAVSILRQELGAVPAQKFQDGLDQDLIADANMRHLQTVVQGALDAMGNQSRGEEMAAEFIRHVKSAVATARDQLKLYPPGVKVSGRSQWGLPCEAGSCRDGMCSRAIVACGAFCAVGCAIGACPACLACLATYVGCCECASQDFGFSCNVCL
eukprot:TRINITY_DN3400_c0_g1_i1.p1 TRINITY_DN3400_c0_g1~~TRINITY_DN3400_c0_g1_i1.p1  ORF type:complete len:194 (+),score=27.50 TRINITY_DN3400_c0_g1_i1:96-677(+)